MEVCDIVQEAVIKTIPKKKKWLLLVVQSGPLLIATGEAIPLRGLEGVPGLAFLLLGDGFDYCLPYNVMNLRP